MIWCGVLTVAIIAFTRETRGSIILSRRAKRLRKQTGDGRYQCRADAEKANLAVLIKVSLTRPLCTSPPPAPLTDPSRSVLKLLSQTSSAPKPRFSSSRCVPLPLLSLLTLPDSPRNASSYGRRSVGGLSTYLSVRAPRFLASFRLETDFSPSSSRYPPDLRQRRASSSSYLPPLPPEPTDPSPPCSMASTRAKSAQPSSSSSSRQSSVSPSPSGRTECTPATSPSVEQKRVCTLA